MRLAIFGGTFNPPHNGHIAIAHSVLNETRYDSIVFVPTNIPAHKPKADRITPEDRLAMVELACMDTPGFLFDSCDIERGGVSYSIDTLRDIRVRYDITDTIGFVLGDDLIDGFRAWRQVEKFAASVELIVAHRLSVATVPFQYPHCYLSNELHPYTSRKIRSIVKLGRSIAHMVPPRVEEYILESCLYR